MVRTYGWLFLIVFSLSLGSAPGAADPVSDLEGDYGELVVTASRTPARRSEVGSSVTVITSAEIVRRREPNVLQLLRNTPGVQVATSGGPGTTSGIFLRGANDVHTLVLIDGVRVHSNTLGTAAIQNLTTDNIDRIEIVRGPQSVLYGSDAIGGVIQIFTKKGTEDRTTFAYEGGTYGTHLVQASTMGTTENQSYSVAGSWSEAEGYSRFNERRGGLENDAYRNQSASVNWQRRGWLELGANLRYFEGDIDFDATTGDRRADVSGNRDLVFGLDLARSFGERWRHALQLSGVEDNNTTMQGVLSEITSVTKTAKWQSEYAWSDDLRFVGGFTSEKQEGESISNDVTRFSKSFITNSYFLEGRWSWRDRLHLTLGGRQDHHSTFGDHATWRATASYQARPRTRLFATYGTGFKAPTFNQLFFPGTFGNPNLAPEESRGWDAGFEHDFGARATLRGAYFLNDFENLIEFAGAGSQAINVSRASARGVEVEGALAITPRLRLEAQYTNTEARDERSHRYLNRRPEDVVTASLSWNPYDPLDLDLFYRNVSPSFGSSNERQRTDGYHTLGAVLGYTWRDRHRFWVRGENIWNEKYEDVVPFGTPGGSWFGGYEFSF